MRKNKVSHVEICSPIIRLTFLNNGAFVLDGEHIFPQKTDEDSLNGLLRIVKLYQKRNGIYDYLISTHQALALCLDDLCQRVRNAIFGGNLS